MNAKNQWRVFAVSVFLATILNVHQPPVLAYEYDLTVTTGGDADDPTFEITGSVERMGWASYTANQDGCLTCSTDAYTWVVGDSASLTKSAWAAVRYEWEWDGPPGTEPGGSLYWDFDGDGSATADGNTFGSGGSATSTGTTWSEIRALPPDTGLLSQWGEAWGSVTHGATGTGDTSSGGALWVETTEDPDGNSYIYHINWNGYYTGTDDIPEGTSVFLLFGAAMCQGESETYSSATVESEADTTSNASVWVYGSFTSN